MTVLLSNRDWITSNMPPFWLPGTYRLPSPRDSTRNVALSTISSECGCILAIFCGSFNARFLKTDQNIMIAYQFVGGISCFFYPMWFYFWGLSAGTSACIIWCCFWRFITGLSFAFITVWNIQYIDYIHALCPHWQSQHCSLPYVYRQQQSNLWQVLFGKIPLSPQR